MNISRRSFLSGAAFSLAVAAIPGIPILAVMIRRPCPITAHRTIDGVQLTKGDHILFRGRAENNGVWCVTKVEGGITTVERICRD